MTDTKVDEKFNGEMNLLKAITISSLVLIHVLLAVVVQPLAFQMPLFYFISGYFYNEDHEVKKSKYLWSKFKKHVGGFYLNLILMVIFSMIIWLRYDFSLGVFSLRNIFVIPFTLGLGNWTGDSGFLLNASWFIITLFFIQTTFILVYPLIKKVFKNDILKLIFFLLLGIISIVISNKIWSKNDAFFWIRNQWLFVILKITVGWMFYYLGIFYRKNIENKINIFQIKFLILSILALAGVWIFVPEFNMIFFQSEFLGYTFLPIIVSVLGIYVSIFAAKGLNKIIKNRNNILHKIGRNSSYIMYFNYPVFFVVSLIYLNISKVDSIYYRDLVMLPYIPNIIDLKKFWPLYFLAALLLPTFCGEVGVKIKRFLYSTDNKNKVGGGGTTDI